MDHSNQATIRAVVNGQPTMLVLDTGASRSMLDSSFYKGVLSKAADYDPSDLPANFPKHGLTNGIKVDIGYINSLQSGTMDFGKGPVIVTSLPAATRLYNARHSRFAVGGLLGEDILHRFSAIIDWRRRGVYFNTDPAKRMKVGPGLVAAGWTAIPMVRTDANLFVVACHVEGSPVRLIVDTGAAFTAFNRSTIPLKNIVNNVGALRTEMIGHESTARPARIDQWQIGNYNVPSTYVSVATLPQQLLVERSVGDGPVLGLLGSEVLARNNAIIDITGSTLYLKPK